MAKIYRMPKKYCTSRKYKGKCENCGEKTPEKEIFQHIDESNIAITYNAPFLCKNCYLKKYGEK